MKSDTWYDLSAHGLQPLVVQVPSKRVYLGMLGQPGSAAFAAAQASLGFKPAPSKPELLVRSVNLDAKGNIVWPFTDEQIRETFPGARSGTYDPDVHFKDQSRATKAPAAQKAPISGGRSLGPNSLGQSVFEAEDGTRYTVDERRRTLPEAEAGPGQRGNFLRATSADGALDYEALAKCAQGLVESASRGAVVGPTEFAAFLETIGTTDAEAARTAIETASAAHLARKGGKTLREAFIAGYNLTTRLPFLSGAREPRLGLQPPVAIAAQRLLGLLSDTYSQPVLVEGPGAGEMLTHLPKDATVRIRTSSPASLVAAEAVASAAGLRNLAEAGNAGPAFGRVMANLTGLGAPGPTALDRIRAILSDRAADGEAVFVIDAPADAAGQEALAEYRNELAATYAFEGEAAIEAGLVGDAPRRGGQIMLCVGQRRPSRDDALPPPAVSTVEDWSGLWTWAAAVVSARANIDLSTLPAAQAVVDGGRTDATGNAFQTPYLSASKVGQPKTMVPRNLEGATQEALSRAVAASGGDVDAWVAREFSYTPEDLSRLFSPEQVDALALYLLAEKRDRGFLTADQTGVGKGRFIAAVLRRNALKGFPTLFLTEKQMNLSDIWRDIVHTESAHLFTPLVLNDGVQIIDEATKQAVLRSAPREQVDAMLVSKAWPEGVNLILSTYSQFNSEAGPADPSKDVAAKDPTFGKRKADWMASAIDKRHRLVNDECHNAVSMTSNTSKNLVEAVKRSDAAVVYSSATFAKNAEHMAFYAPLFPDGVSVDELESMMKTGGESFQEVLSWMLAHDGVMIRREFDLSKVTYSTVIDTPRFERNRAYMDAVAPVLHELVQLSGDVDELIKRQNAGGAQEEAARQERRRKIKPFHLTKTGMGSPLYTISRLFVTALKVDAVVEAALAALADNKKPVIFVENTVQSLLDEISETEANAEGTAVADFRALFNRTIRSMTHARWKDTKDVQHTRDMADSDPALRARVDKIRRMVDALPHLPVSSIDEVKRRIREGGWSIDEITGRDVEITDGRVVRRPATNPTVVKNAFNNGDLDAVIINAAGSTGIDLHAGSRFQDQRQRVMMELQSPSDILRRVQGHGRINRYDQVADPEIMSFASGLPIEMRLRAMENAHVRRLSANTTSNRDAAILTRDIPDLINPVGDLVCSRYAEARPELMRRLGFAVEDVVAASDANRQLESSGADAMREVVAVSRSGTKAGKGDDGSAKAREARERKVREGAFQVRDSKRTANEILGRLIMLPVSLQERICNELTAEFKAATEEMEARGETPLRTQELPGIVHTRTRTVFDGAETERTDSVFHEPLFVIDGAQQQTGKPMRSEDLMERIQIGVMGSGRAQSCIDRLRGGMEEILRPFLPNGCLSVEEALMREEGRERQDITRRKARIERLAFALEQVRPGKEIACSFDEAKARCIVTRVEYPDRGYEHVPGGYGVEFVVAGDEKPRTMRLETLMRDPAFAVSDGLEGRDYDEILKSFDKAEKNKLTTVNILVHNVYRAMRLNVEHKLGKLQTFVLADGTRHRGVVLSKSHRNLNAVPVALKDADMAWEALAHRKADLVGNSTLADKGFMMRPVMGGDAVEVRLPKKKSKMGFIYDHETLAGLHRRWAPTAAGADSAPRLIIDKKEARDLVKAIYESGAAFWCSPMERDWAKRYLKDRKPELDPAEEADEAAPVGMVA